MFAASDASKGKRSMREDPTSQPLDDDGDELLTVCEVAKRLRVDDTTVRRWIKNGALDAITLPHRGKRRAYRIRRRTLKALYASPDSSLELVPPHVNSHSRIPNSREILR
jgi:excisionase family DNA binding protein